MKDKILQQLHLLERQYNITILMAVDGGSYGYGYASPESDHDVRFIYVNRPDYYFAITPKADNIEIKDDGCGMDFVGYDLQKALGLILKGNALMAEWINSDICYIARDDAKEKLREYSNACFNLKGSINHYLGISSRHNERYLQKELTLKRMIYYIRGLMACVWIDKHHSNPPMNIYELADTTIDADEIKTMVIDMLDFKRQNRQHNDSIVSPQIYEYFKALSDRFEFIARAVPMGKRPDIELEMSKYLRETVLSYNGYNE